MPRQVLSELQNVVLLAMAEEPLAQQVAVLRGLLDGGRKLWHGSCVDLHGIPTDVAAVVVAVSILEMLEARCSRVSNSAHSRIERLRMLIWCSLRAGGGSKMARRRAFSGIIPSLRMPRCATRRLGASSKDL